MAKKVFLFREDTWLYCSSVSFDGKVYKGYVVNGGWNFIYSVETEIMSHRLGKFSCKLTWSCDPKGSDYNDVIENAKQRYKSGELPNYNLELLKEEREYELYLKLKAKYDPEVAF